MKKNTVVLMICLCMGLSASASLPVPSISKEEKESVKLKADCFSFTWTPSCSSSPMTSSVCGGGDNPFYMLYLMFDTWATIEGILCPSNPGGPLDPWQS